MKILTIGDVVGRRSIEYLAGKLRRAASNLGADFVVCNGENASEIHGLCKADAEAILNCGVDLITLGNHAFGSRDIYTWLDDNTDVIIRPANYPAACPGVGHTICSVSGLRILCMNLSGTAFMDPLERERGEYDLALLDFHAEATSEKLAMGYHLDGRVQIVFGTHTHVPTADGRVLPKGTGYITDLGMTGPTNGILGTDTEAVLYKMRTHMPTRFTVADGEIEAQAVLFTLEDRAPYRCLKVERVTF